MDSPTAANRPIGHIDQSHQTDRIGGRSTCKGSGSDSIERSPLPFTSPTEPSLELGRVSGHPVTPGESILETPNKGALVKDHRPALFLGLHRLAEGRFAALAKQLVQIHCFGAGILVGVVAMPRPSSLDGEWAAHFPLWTAVEKGLEDVVSYEY